MASRRRRKGRYDEILRGSRKGRRRRTRRRFYIPAIRGLCWCEETREQFVSRDGDWARNILRVYRSMVRGKLVPMISGLVNRGR